MRQSLINSLAFMLQYANPLTSLCTSDPSGFKKACMLRSSDFRGAGSVPLISRSHWMGHFQKMLFFEMYKFVFVAINVNENWKLHLNPIQINSTATGYYLNLNFTANLNITQLPSWGFARNFDARGNTFYFGMQSFFSTFYLVFGWQK